MRITTRIVLSLVTLSALLCAFLVLLLQTPALDTREYFLVLSDEDDASPAFTLSVYGIGNRVKVVRLIRFPSPKHVPRNTIDIPRAASEHISRHTRYRDRWDDEVSVLAGRSLDEVVELRVDSSYLDHWLTFPPNQSTKDYAVCSKMWRELVVPNVPNGHDAW